MNSCRKKHRRTVPSAWAHSNHT